ncbi:MAG: hypothetical protein Q7S96_02645 [bacterium]|nr:hypothetical protein [bacterium]
MTLENAERVAQVVKAGIARGRTIAAHAAEHGGLNVASLFEFTPDIEAHCLDAMHGQLVACGQHFTITERARASLLRNLDEPLRTYAQTLRTLLVPNESTDVPNCIERIAQRAPNDRALAHILNAALLDIVQCIVAMRIRAGTFGLLCMVRTLEHATCDGVLARSPSDARALTRPT